MYAQELKHLTDVMNQGNISEILREAKENAYHGIYFLVYPIRKFSSKLDYGLFKLGLEQLGFTITEDILHDDLCISWDK